MPTPLPPPGPDASTARGGSILAVPILPQPDDLTCGPTSLHAVYRYFGLDLPLDRVIEDVRALEEGGTLAVFLGLDALRRGFGARVFSYNLRVFDPTWSQLGRADLQAKLERRMRLRRKKRRLRTSIQAYLQFLDLGGDIVLDDLTTHVLEHYFAQGLPVLAGLSATYLYRSPRERDGLDGRMVDDDVGGDPQGHFVVLCGFERDGRVLVADPFRENPISRDHYYHVDVDRLIHSILLGIVTYDANLLVLTPPPAP